MQNTPDFYIGSSVTIEIANKPYTDRSDYLPLSAQDYRDADSVDIKVYDPCNNLFIDCPMYKCPDRAYGWYLFRIQTDDNYPAGLYKAEVTVSNTVADIFGACSTGTSGTTATSGTSGSSTSYVAATKAVKYFRLMERELH